MCLKIRCARMYDLSGPITQFEAKRSPKASGTGTMDSSNGISAGFHRHVSSYGLFSAAKPVLKLLELTVLFASTARS